MAEVSWCAEDIVQYAKDAGITMSVEQASMWLEEREDELLIEMLDAGAAFIKGELIRG